MSNTKCDRTLSDADVERVIDALGVNQCTLGGAIRVMHETGVLNAYAVLATEADLYADYMLVLRPDKAIKDLVRRRKKA